jgi:hypothetical protein
MGTSLGIGGYRKRGVIERQRQYNPLVNKPDLISAHTDP